MFQTVELNLVPGGDMPVVNASQFDTNRVIRFALMNNGEAYRPRNLLSAEFIIRKVDGTLVTQDDAVFASNFIDLFTTEQMTACAGKNIGELRLTFNDPDVAEENVIISTLNFILEVERSPELGGITSESEIANLDTQIASIVDEQLDNYYTKTEIDDQIETIVSEQVTPIVADIVAEQVPPAVQSELDNYYTKDDVDTYFYNKTETDTLLSGKADTSDLPDMTNYYDKSETDTLLSGKVSNSTLNDYYNKTQVDNLIAGVSTDFTTAINTPAAVQTFSDGGDHIPMKSCEVAIVAQQASGTPSPSNPLPITGFSSVAVSVSDGVTPTTTNVSLGQTIYGGTAELVGGNGTKTHKNYDFGDLTWTYDSSNLRFYAPLTGVFVNDNGYAHTVGKCSHYSPYFTDVTVDYNNMIVDTSDKNEIWWLYTNNAGVQNLNVKNTAYTDANTFKTAMTGVKVVIPLETPTAFTFTGANIPTLSGVNNVYANSGDVNELEYFTDKADDIASMVRLMTRS